MVRHGYVKFNKFMSLWNSYFEKNLVLAQLYHGWTMVPFIKAYYGYLNRGWINIVQTWLDMV